MRMILKQKEKIVWMLDQYNLQLNLAMKSIPVWFINFI